MDFDYAIVKALVNRGMHISFISVSSIMIFSVCFILLFGLLIRQRRLYGIRYNLLLLCMLLMGIRMLFPVELLDYSYSVGVPYVLPDITSFLGKEAFSLGGESVSGNRLLGWIWMAGAALMLARTMWKYWRFRRMVTVMEPVKDERVMKVLEQVNRVYGRRRRFAIVTSKGVSSPMVTGLCRSYIILPEEPMTDEELYYTLCHELAHYYGGDLHIKFLWEIGKSFLWWNPLVYLFQKQLCGLLELRADDRVVKRLENSEKLDYAECLVQMAKRQRESQDRQAFVLAYGGTGCFTLKQRIEILCRRMSDEKQRKLLSDAVLVLCLVLVITVPNIMFVPDAPAADGIVYPEEEEFSTWDKGVFMIDNRDGTYDFYYECEYCYTMDDVINLVIRVYPNLEEALENEQKK